MDKIICTMCFATLASILAAPMIGTEANSITYPTLWMAGATLAVAVATLVIAKLRLRRNS